VIHHLVEKKIFVNVKPSIIPLISCLEYNNDLSEEKIIDYKNQYPFRFKIIFLDVSKYHFAENSNQKLIPLFEALLILSKT
jgi:hypothetical protein